MPAEFLRDVGRSIDRPRLAGRWSVLPFSVAAHAAAALAIFIIPLSAEIELPSPAPLGSPLHITAVHPVPPPAASAADAPAVRQGRAAAPVAAASGFEPESPAGAPGGDPFVPAGPGSTLGSVGGVGEMVDLPPAPAALPPPVSREPLRPGGVIREPQKLVHVAPVYPPLARAARVEGTVVLDAIISADGTIENIRVVRSIPLLDAAAIEAVRGWRYTPTRLNGVPVPVLLTISVTFTLQR